MTISSQDDDQEGEDGEQIGELYQDGRERQKNDSRGKLVNYYFTNFPNDCNQANLRDLFTKSGEVTEVYVARKVSKEGKRFGFARFSNVKNSVDLENRLNRIWIKKFNLKVNIAKYEKPVYNGNQRTFIRLPSPNVKDGFNFVEVKVDGRVFKFEFPTSATDHEIVFHFKKAKEPGKNRNKAHDQNDLVVNDAADLTVNENIDIGRKRPKELATKEDIVIDGGENGKIRNKTNHEVLVESMDVIENGGVKLNEDASVSTGESATNHVKCKAATQVENKSDEPVIPVVMIGKIDRKIQDASINKGYSVDGDNMDTHDVGLKVTKTVHALDNLKSRIKKLLVSEEIDRDSKSSTPVDTPHFKIQTGLDGSHVSCGLNLVDKGKPKSLLLVKKKTCKSKKIKENGNCNCVFYKSDSDSKKMNNFESS